MVRVSKLDSFNIDIPHSEMYLKKVFHVHRLCWICCVTCVFLYILKYILPACIRLFPDYIATYHIFKLII